MGLEGLVGGMGVSSMGRLLLLLAWAVSQGFASCFGGWLCFCNDRNRNLVSHYFGSLTSACDDHTPTIPSPIAATIYTPITGSSSRPSHRALHYFIGTEYFH